MQLIIIYTGLPQLGIKLGVIASALIGLGVNEGAYLAEIIRAGISAVPRGQFEAERRVPNIVALRRRLDEICRQELESFREERGPFTRAQDQLLQAIATQLMQKMVGSLARELKELPRREDGERMAAVLTRLFHLDSPQTAAAGTTLKREKNETLIEPTIAINY